MRVADVMTRGVDLLSPDASVQEAATRMAEADVGALLIGNDGVLEGVLTDRDIILRVVVDGLDNAGTRVRDVMSSTLFTCREADTVESAFREMSERQVRRLPVLDEEGALSGIVTLSDLSRLEQDPQRTSELLREIAEPHRRRSAEAGPAPAEPGAAAAEPGTAAAESSASAAEPRAADVEPSATQEGR